MKRILIHILTILIVLLLSCDEDETAYLTGSSGVVLPLVTGNRWEFKKTSLDRNGFVIDTSSVTMDVMRPDTMGHLAGYILRNQIFWFIDPGRMLLANRSDGLYTATGPLAIPPPPPTIARALVYPTFIGDTLTYQGYLIRTTAVSQSVTVQAGTFSCIVYDVLMNSDTVASILSAPNVGFVKVWQQIGFVREIHELRTYHLQ